MFIPSLLIGTSTVTHKNIDIKSLSKDVHDEVYIKTIDDGLRRGIRNTVKYKDSRESTKII